MVLPSPPGWFAQQQARLRQQWVVVDAQTGEAARELGTWAQEAALAPLDAVAALARHWAAVAELAGSGALLDALPLGASSRAVPPTLADALAVSHGPPPYALGVAYEAVLHAGARRARGAFYTPAPIARRLLDVATGPLGALPPLQPDEATVWDPACGGGAFLLAAADWLVAAGLGPADAIGRLAGCDIDPGAIAVAQTALRWWCLLRSGGDPGPLDGVTQADGLAAVGEGSPRFTLVVGNPPFLNQLQRATARTADERAQAAARFGAAGRGYVDTATLFVLAALDRAAVGGRVALVQPESFLVAAHGRAAREEIVGRATLRGLWRGGRGIFAAGVGVCAPVLAVGGPASGAATQLRIWDGPEFRPSATEACPPSRWAALLGRGRGVGLRVRPGAGRIGDLATATAGFRDQFYGLVPYVREAEPGLELGPGLAPLVTSGLIGPGWCRWGERATRFAKRRFEAPVIDVAALVAADPKLGRWLVARLVPKLVVATQATVVEATIDRHGRWVPSVPVIAVEPRVHLDDDDDGLVGRALARIAAVLLAPAITAFAFENYGGSGLSEDALRLSARNVAELPLPVDVDAWEAGAAFANAACETSNATIWRANMTRLAQAMNAAYQVSEPDRLQDWWLDRLPRHPTATIS